MTDTQRSGDAVAHLGTLEGSLAVGDAVRAEVDEGRRWGAARNHTGTHLLHRALRDVLGEQAKQAGSWVGPEGLRFDFPASAATPREALREVERLVNAQIRRDAEVHPEQMAMADAQALGADMFFGEKYLPESVRVVQVDGYSKELCGGTHVASTGQIGAFVITGESSIGAGLRRIEAVTGETATELIGDRLEALRAVAVLLGEKEEAVPARVEALLGRLREAERAAKAPKASQARPAGRGRGDSRRPGRRQREGHHPVLPRAPMRAHSARLPTTSAAAPGASSRSSPASPTASRRSSWRPRATWRRRGSTPARSSARRRRSSAVVAGDGADLAQAGGRDADRLEEALREAGRLALEALQRIESA